MKSAYINVAITFKLEKKSESKPEYFQVLIMIYRKFIRF